MGHYYLTLNDFFYNINDLDSTSLADDNTPYSCLSDMISVLGQLKGGIDEIFYWFTKNFHKGNADKCHLITSSKAHVEMEVSNIAVISEEKVKLLGIYINSRLNYGSPKVPSVRCKIFLALRKSFNVSCKIFLIW